jgi:DNA-binding transcriptional LysR family regulator
MELRHLRYFLAVAEELHFARAAERLHIEQSPLSRAIKELEYDLRVQLFERTTRSTRLTWTGQVLLERVRRIFASIDQAKADVMAAATGYRGSLRVALSGGVAPWRLAALLAICRAEEPEVEIRLFQIPFSQQVRGLCDNLYDVGFAQWGDGGAEIIATAVWTDPLVVALPARHPLLMHKQIPLEELLRYPLVLCHPEQCEGVSRQIERILRAVNIEPHVVERVTTHDLLLTLIAAGYGAGITSAP